VFYHFFSYLPLIMFVEIFRRMMWAILRVEWEHVQVMAKFYQHDYVPVFFALEGDHAHSNNGGRRHILVEIAIAAVVMSALAYAVIASPY
jgi:hypothetical protein